MPRPTERNHHPPAARAAHVTPTQRHARWRTTGIGVGLPALLLAAALAATLALLPASQAPAPLNEAEPSATGGGYDLSWWSADGGGGSASGGGYSLLGSLGQPDASASDGLTGGCYALTGGLPAAGGVTAPAAPAMLYLPLVVR